jgi:hypothetical protein
MHPPPPGAARCRLDAEERVARTLLAAGRHEEAASATRTLFATASNTGQPLHATRLLLLLARVHREAAAPLPALPYALAAAHHARALHADQLAAEAAVELARLWSDMGGEGAARAAAELEAAMPFVLAHGSAELAAGAQGALAEALMAAAASRQELEQRGDWWAAALRCWGAVLGGAAPAWPRRCSTSRPPPSQGTSEGACPAPPTHICAGCCRCWRRRSGSAWSWRMGRPPPTPPT